MTSNPFCTRFVRPGAIEFRFHVDTGDQDSMDVQRSSASVASIVDQILDHRFSLVMGPHGSGKSTLLRTLLPSLRPLFSEVAIVQTIACSSPRLPARFAHARGIRLDMRRAQRRLNETGLLVIDGIEQLAFPFRAELLRAAKRKSQFVLATSHQRLWSFHTVHETRVTGQLIESLTRSLLVATEKDLSHRLLAELRGRDLTALTDVRSLWFDLYDVAESAQAKSFPAVAHGDRHTLPAVQNASAAANHP